MKNPKTRMWLWLIISSVLIGLALFLSAGTINYWQAWVYLGVGAALWGAAKTDPPVPVLTLTSPLFT
jgi:hypothetical protein